MNSNRKEIHATLKAMNHLMLPDPMHLPIHGQWWSMPWIQQPQSWQCSVPFGWWTRQYSQKWVRLLLPTSLSLSLSIVGSIGLTCSSSMSPLPLPLPLPPASSSSPALMPALPGRRIPGSVIPVIRRVNREANAHRNMNGRSQVSTDLPLAWSRSIFRFNTVPHPIITTVKSRPGQCGPTVTRGRSSSSDRITILLPIYLNPK